MMRMIRILCVLIASLLASAAFADFVTISRDTANIRAEPDRDSAFILSAVRDDQFSLLDDGDQQNGYYHIDLPDIGEDGFVYRNRVRRSPGPLPGEGTVDVSRHVFGGLPNVSALNEEINVLGNMGYAVAYSEFRFNPTWSAYRLEGASSGSCQRRRSFLQDRRTDARVVHDDYTNTGYDRGHMAPNAGIGGRFGCTAQDQTFRLSNIVPQLPTLNQETWEAFERRESDLAEQFGAVSVITGPIYADTNAQFLCDVGIEVPVSFYKILIRETSPPQALAIVMGQDIQNQHPVSDFVTTIDSIEALTGIDFFTELADPIEDTLEMAQPSPDWGLDHVLNPTFVGVPRPLCTVSEDELFQ